MIKASKKLLLIVLAIMSIAVIDGIFTLREIQLLENDAKIINYAGIIRGSIQRISKLELNHSPTDDLILDVQMTINNFINLREHFRMGGNEKKFSNLFVKLNSHWEQFVKSLDTYRKMPDDEKFRQEFVRQSEICWKKSNQIVFLAQYDSENKVRYFRNTLLLTVANIVLLLVVLWLIKSYVRDKLEDMANYDPLTRAFNRALFNNVLEKEVSRSLRHGNPLSLTFIDIDFFKKVNDQYGHHFGDLVLTEFSRTVKSNIRESDFFCRIGGEEFAIVSPETDLKGAENAAEKIRALTEAHEFTNGIKITLSIGITQFVNNENTDALIKRTDEYLYRAKEKGRNRVEMS